MDSRRSFFSKAWAEFLGLFGVGTVAAAPMPNVAARPEPAIEKLLQELRSCAPQGWAEPAVDPCRIDLPWGAIVVRLARWMSWEGKEVKGNSSVAFAWSGSDAEAMMEKLRTELVPVRFGVLTVYGAATIRPGIVTVGRAYQNVFYVDYTFTAELL